MKETVDYIIYWGGAFLIRIKNVPRYTQSSDVLNKYAEQYYFRRRDLSCTIVDDLNTIDFTSLVSIADGLNI